MIAPLIDTIQLRTVVVAISPSTTRGKGTKGVVAAAHKFLGGLDLRQFGTDSESRFARALDRETEELRLAFPRDARHWGLARKCLNIFLRHSFYNLFLSQQYNLEWAEEFYEVPLDSYVATGLCAVLPDLPRWRTIKGLEPKESALFQAAALALSRRRGITRVHLDSFLWLEGREKRGL
jgi:hypothetical protein